MTPDQKKLAKAASRRGITIVDRGSGHIQLMGGPLLVNYYPRSKTQTAYVAGTTEKKTRVSPEQAIEMCFTAPEIKIAGKDKRGKQKNHKLRLFRRNPRCKWCGRKFLKIAEATIEHIIPLARGGLDNLNNKALACPKCNHSRGHEMPELKNSGQEMHAFN